MKLNSLGLASQEAEVLAAELNVFIIQFSNLLSKFERLALEYSWKTFSDWHLKFEEWYNDSQLKIDLIAERIFTF